MSKGYYAGCDVGSTTTKAVILNSQGIIADSIVPSKTDPEDSANAALDEAIQKVNGLDRIQDLNYLVGTGYGRTQIPFANKNISELSCHAIGAYSCDPKIKSVVDIGGQDLKAISINEDGSLCDFVMNDKCAAGTGKFFEAMSRVFGVELCDFSSLSLEAKKSIPITSQCSVFAESEVLSLIAKKTPPREIALGIQESVANRCHVLLRRIGIREKVAITGGCAKNAGLVAALTKMIKLDIVQLSIDPQLIGAFGAAIFAQRDSKAS